MRHRLFNVAGSPCLSFAGPVGAAQVSCIGGCATFTIASTAWTDLNPCFTGTASSVVCATPWLSGIGKPGTAGATCAAGLSVTPPGVSAGRSAPLLIGVALLTARWLLALVR